MADLTPAGKVCTGFSMPYVATYGVTDGAITYTNGMRLARGVSVELELETSDMNHFYADNIVAENAGGYMTSGEVTLEVDGLFQTAEKFIMGLPEANEQGWMDYDDRQDTPELGLGFIARYMSGGVTTYVPTVLYRVKFQQITKSAETQEEEIDWQTQELVADILRADIANHPWQSLGKDYATEQEALEALQQKLGINSSSEETTETTDTTETEGA